MAKKTKKPVKATAKKKTTAHAAAPKASKPAKVIVPLSKVQPAGTPRTKSEILGVLAETTGLSKKDVSSVFGSLSDLIGKDVGKKGCGLFTVPGLLKIRRINKPATKARKGINPFTGEETTFKAKPARNVVKIRPLKALKDMV
ncbi:MAG: HU family DNA-binding protein [Proteobacteria bacterium]|jgi:nucleoid DNA-binding protein|nr:HU family DNA-binding protein [Pseudomonadota bacterium]